jgi:desulfoferrodoxin (superoxide reductase-like protein)
MRSGKKEFVLAVCAIALFGLTTPSWAGKSSVTIEAPATAQKGSEITIKLNVAHDGNSVAHHTEWVYVKVNGKEIERWEYGAFKRPESEKFSKEVKITVNEPIEIIAEASCNLHGSAGPAKAKVEIK